MAASALEFESGGIGAYQVLANKRIQKTASIALNRDQVRGSFKDAAGKAREKAGKLTGSTGQQVRGLAKQAEGRAQKGMGDAKHAMKNSDSK